MEKFSETFEDEKIFKKLWGNFRQNLKGKEPTETFWDILEVWRYI